MKGFRIYLLVIILLLIFPTIALANAGPTYWQAYPSWEVMAIDENSPIIVNNEELVFDFSEIDHLSYRVSGDVAATYQMKNPTDQTQSVQMAFPFVETLSNLKNDELMITADGENLSYEIYIGDKVNNYGSPYEKDNKENFDFPDIINTITDETYNAMNFEKTQKGKLYTLEVRPTTDQEVNLAIDFEFDHKKTDLFLYGFNGWSRDEEQTRLSSWCKKPSTLEVFVLGEDIDLSIKGFEDGEMLQETEKYSYDLTTQEIQLDTYLYNYIEETIEPNNQKMISDTQIYNLYAKSMDEYFTKNLGICSEHDLSANIQNERIFVLVYNVEFQPKSDKEVSVSYKTTATMDKTKTSQPLYIIDYILNPAQYWSDFNNLNIRIITNEELPYIVDSNIDFSKGDNNIYTATLDDLPKNDLTFTLYNKEKITLMDKVKGNLNRHFGYFTPIVVGIIILILLVIMVKLFKKR